MKSLASHDAQQHHRELFLSQYIDCNRVHIFSMTVTKFFVGEEWVEVVNLRGFREFERVCTA